MEKGKITNPLKLLLIGGSAGSLNVLLNVLPSLKPDLALCIVIVTHRKNTSDTLLEDLLSSRTTISVKEIEDKEVLQKGTIYITPPDYHILFENNGTLSLDYSEKINYSRPSIDVAFESAGVIYKENLTCILLSGANSDGVQGLIEVKRHHGVTVVQEPHTAATPYMPLQALHFMKPDYLLTPDEMITFINNL